MTEELVQGYLAHQKFPPPKDPTVGLCLGPYGGPGRGGVSDERGTPVRGRCPAKMAHTRQSRPAFGLGFQGEAIKLFPFGLEAACAT